MGAGTSQYNPSPSPVPERSAQYNRSQRPLPASRPAIVEISYDKRRPRNRKIWTHDMEMLNDVEVDTHKQTLNSNFRVSIITVEGEQDSLKHDIGFGPRNKPEMAKGVNNSNDFSYGNSSNVQRSQISFSTGGDCYQEYELWKPYSRPRMRVAHEYMLEKTNEYHYSPNGEFVLETEYG